MRSNSPATKSSASWTRPPARRAQAGTPAVRLSRRARREHGLPQPARCRLARQTRLRGRCCVGEEEADSSLWRHGSDGEGKFSEDRLKPAAWLSVKSEFVVAVAQVLNEGVPAAVHLGAAEPFQAAHRTGPSLQPAMIGVDPVVGAQSAQPRRRVPILQPRPSHHLVNADQTSDQTGKGSISGPAPGPDHTAAATTAPRDR